MEQVNYSADPVNRQYTKVLVISFVFSVTKPAQHYRYLLAYVYCIHLFASQNFDDHGAIRFNSNRFRHHSVAR